MRAKIDCERLSFKEKFFTHAEVPYTFTLNELTVPTPQSKIASPNTFHVIPLVQT